MLVPWLAGAVIDVLKNDVDFMAACNSKLSGRATSDTSIPYATVQTVQNAALPQHGGVWRGIVQVDGWAPPQVPGTDPCLAAWRIAAEAWRVLADIKGYSYEGFHCRIHPVEGPVERVDTSRGLDSPMYGAYIRVELTVKHGV